MKNRNYEEEDARIGKETKTAEIRHKTWLRYATTTKSIQRATIETQKDQNK